MRLSIIQHKIIVKPVNPFILLAGIVLVFIAFSAWYVFLKPGRSIKQEQANAVKAEDIYNAYLGNENSANLLYLDKALIVTGYIAEVNTNQQGQQVIVLQTSDPIFGIVCTMSNPVNAATGKEVRIKGFCTGYTTDVVLRDCIIEN